MEDPVHPSYPQELLNVVGPRNMVHSWATNVYDPTVQQRWGKIGKQKTEDAGTVANGIISGLDWFPTFVAAVGNPNIKEDLKRRKEIGDRTYKNHLDSYNQMDMITGKGPSNRHEIFYFGESTLGAMRIDDYKHRFIEQPNGWLGGKVHVDAPSITNLRLDPFERVGAPDNGALNGAQGYFNQWFLYQLWCFVFVRQEVAKLAMRALEYTHAEGRELQPRCRKSEDRGSHEGTRVMVTA